MNENLVIALVSLLAIVCLFAIETLKQSAYKNTPEGAEENSIKPSATVYNFNNNLADKLKWVVVFSVFFSFIMNAFIGFK